MTDKLSVPKHSDVRNPVLVIAEQYPVVTPDEMENLTLSRTLLAETATAVLAEPESHSLDEMTGEPFYLDGIDFFTYSQVKGREDDLYAYINCHWDNGNGFTVTTGSPFVLVRAHRLKELQVLPRRVMSVLVESRRNQGQSSLWIVDAPEARDNGVGRVLEATAEIIP